MRIRARLGPLVLVVAAAMAAQLVTSLTPASALVELGDAEERRASIEELLAATGDDLEAREQQVAEVRAEIDGLDDRDAELRAELDDVEAALADRARTAYMTGGGTVFEAVLAGEAPGDAVERATLLDALALGDRGSMEQMAALRTRLDQTRELREGRLAQLQVLEAELEADLRAINAELEAAAAEIRRLELKAQNQREVDLPFLQGIYGCPVADPVAFRDTWGDPRSGGRSHKGVDMFAPHGTPVHAIVDGSITRLNNSGLGGISVYLFGDDGNEYYYTHLQGYVDGLSVGQRVEAGDHIAFNGSSGNADAYAPHVHFQVHPGGGSPVNPYPYAAAACGRWTPGQDARGNPPPTVAG